MTWPKPPAPRTFPNSYSANSTERSKTITFVKFLYNFGELSFSTKQKLRLCLRTGSPPSEQIWTESASVTLHRSFPRLAWNDSQTGLEKFQTDPKLDRLVMRRSSFGSVWNFSRPVWERFRINGDSVRCVDKIHLEPSSHYTVWENDWSNFTADAFWFQSAVCPNQKY